MPRFIDPGGTYADYTSEEIAPNTSGNNQRGVFQVEITSGTCELQARIDGTAPWVTLKTFAVSAMVEVVLAPFYRVVAAGQSEAWLVETK